MQRDARAYPADMLDAATLIRQFTQGKTFDDYLVWQAVQHNLPDLMRQAKELLAELDEDSSS